MLQYQQIEIKGQSNFPDPKLEPVFQRISKQLHLGNHSLKTMKEYILTNSYVEPPPQSTSFIDIDENHELRVLFQIEDEETEFYGFDVSDSAPVHLELSELFQTDDDESDFEGFDISDLNILFLESDDDNDEFLGF